MSTIKVCVEYLEPGMELALDIKGVDGSVLMPRGHVLAENDISRLAGLREASAPVRRESIADEKDWTRRSCVDYARRFFYYVDADDPFLNELFRVSAERVAKARQLGFELRCSDEIAARSVEHLSDVFFSNDLSIESLVLHETKLASFPDIYFKLKQVIDNPASSAKEISQVVSSDVALAGKLLKLVNSPFFGLSSRVDSIERAVSLVGARELSTLALGITTINFFKDIPPELVDMRSFWRHSLSCGVFSKLLAAYRKLPSERLFIAGLLHDAGRLVLFKDMPYASVQALIFARSNLLPQVVAEREIFGFNHAEVGGRLLADWSFPEALVATVAHHHDPHRAPEPVEAAVVQIADLLANAAEISSGGMYMLPAMAPEATKLAGIPAQDISRLMAAHDEAIEELTKALL
ncbi:metal dependent phosphohydrolase [Desulfovibrio sp. X2]|uniref:HDOD domain-containing protein n=1 Tax=Desulfovibrio sp. X2 TaxID=941449 RepID=UPI000358A8A8|nr:HDOD domain-containing protein [Desulfovibrio sp. X2]EPR43789.1 metal dependent phosphohydrolase [Desulfovibrio sp. X2]